MPEKDSGITQELVQQWVTEETTGVFSLSGLALRMGLESRKQRMSLGVALNRLCKDTPTKKAIIKASGKKDGVYQILDVEPDEIDWQEAEDVPVDLILPFGMHNMVEIYEKSIIIVAGTSNVGKTAYLYNFILDNMAVHLIDLYNTETSPGQMRRRMNMMAAAKGMEIPNPAPWKTLDRYDNFEDVLHPDHISVIDYLEITEDFYFIGRDIKRMWRKLNQGVLLIALQKGDPYKDKKGNPVYKDLAIGGQFTKHKAQLYLSFDYTNNPSMVRGKIVKAKVYNGQNPNNRTFTFSIDRGVMLEDTFSWDVE